MTEEKEDPILAAPNLVKDESIPMDTDDNEKQSNTNDNIDSTSDEKDKTSLTYDQRRISLLNNPTYGVILAFLDKFRSNIDIQDYPLYLLEENLLSDEENISRRLIDFHLTLLKRISLGKGAQRDKFPSIIAKFAYRFDFDDGEYLKTNGYSHAEIDIKLRILKNLLETQFDHNQAFKTALVEKPSFEIRSQPFGRDRSGASYWLFLDAECFVRLFRETVDDDRTWTNIATDKDEFENFIKLLITDHVVRKKFLDWKFIHEPFNSLEPSNEFQDRYVPVPLIIKQENVKPSTPPVSPIAPRIKVEKNAKSKKAVSSAPVIKNEVHSDQESSSNSGDKTDRRSRVVSSEETNVNVAPQEINNNQEDEELKSPGRKVRTRRKSATWRKKKRRATSNISKKEEQEQEVLPSKSPTKGRKRKQIIMDDDDIQVTKKNDATSQDKDNIPIFMDDESNCNDLPIALRRSTRVRKPPPTTLPSVTSSPAKSAPQTPTKKKLTNEKGKNSSQIIIKASSQSSKSKSKSKSRGKGRRRRGRKSSVNGVSSSSEEEQQPSEEDEYNSDDYLPTNKQLEELDDDELIEEPDNDDDDFVPRRSAKTVAKRRGQITDNNIEDLQSSSSACCVCSKTDRPEALLLCDDCDDAYHLECLKPILLAVPEGDWYCPLCEHKRFSDKLVEKFIQLIKDYEELEVKRKQCMNKRTNRLANVMVNLDRMVKRSSKKRRTNGIAYSDEENEEEEEENNDNDDDNNKSGEEEDQEDDDDDSVYGFKDDGSIDGQEKSKRSAASSKDRRDRHYVEEPERLGVRSCRRKPKNYCFDDYDKKMKQAMLESGVEDEELDKDLEESDNDGKKKSSKKRAGNQQDEDFEATDPKNDDEFAPDDNNSDASDSEEEEYNDDDTSDDDNWRGKRRTSARKKSNPKSNRRKSRKKSDDDDDDDDSLSDTELSRFQTANTTKSETTTDHDLNETENDDRRRSSRTTTQRNYAKQQDDSNDDDEDVEDLYENGRPPPRRMRYRKRHGSDESFIDDDDDYEKLQRKRKIVQYGKVVSRSSITDHLKNFVDEDEEEEEEEEGKESASASQDGIKEDVEDTSKQTNKVPPTEINEQQPSDDDDFPDEQEIFKANGLLKLQKTLGPPKPPGFRPAFGAPTHSYQHAIVDPTARFAMIRPPVRPAMNNGYPYNGHDPNQGGEIHQPSEINGHNGPSS